MANKQIKSLQIEDTENQLDISVSQTMPVLPKNITFIVNNPDDINANSACHTNISELSDIGRLRFHDTIASCSTRSGVEDIVVSDCRKLILNTLRLTPDEWEVVFTANATDSLNIATALIYNYIKPKKEDYKFFVSTSSHNSLYLPAQKQCINNGYNLQLFDTFKKNMVINSIVSMPYIDNLLGYNHWKTFFSSHKLSSIGIHSKSHNTVFKNTFIILDAAQAGLTLFNPHYNQLHSQNIPKVLPKLNCASAIALSGHKFHAPHIGILVIRKMFLKQDLFKIPELRIGGGSCSNISINPNSPSTVSNLHNGLEAGLINTESIYGLYYWLLFLSSIRNDLLKPVKDAVFWLSIQIKEHLHNFNVIDKHKLNQDFNNILVAQSIILIDCNKLLASDVSHLLKLANIESRHGTFCCDLAVETFKLDNLLRLSFDYTFTKEKAEIVYRELTNIHKTII